MGADMTTLDDTSPVPLYEQLAGILRDMIRAGELLPGDPLPTEHELILKYGVSRTTVRQAVLTLTREGLVHRKPGKGSFVCQPKIVQQLVTLRSFSEEIEILGFKPGARLIRQGWVPANETIAQALGIAPGESVLEVVRLRLADDKELSVNRSYFAGQCATILEGQDLGAPSLYKVIERAVGRITRASEVISATSATQEDAKILKVRPGAPLLSLERTTYVAGGQPVEFVRVHFRPDRYTFFVELKP